MIDYLRLAKSIEYYETKGFQRIESPWFVTQDIINITCPKEKQGVYFLPNKQKELVASGEQSFLQLIKKGYLPNGQYQTTTPCFREEIQGIFHNKTFMKNELIIVGSNDLTQLYIMINHAFNFFLSLGMDRRFLSIEQTKEGYDITYNNIELGSYGIRSCSFVDWIYGTGLAEPRLQYALDSTKGLLNEK